MAFSGEACERVTTCVLASLLLLAVLGSVTGRVSDTAWTTLRVRLTATAVRGGGDPPRPATAADALQTARASAAAERFSNALAAWLPRQRAAMAAVDEVLAKRKQPDWLTGLRFVVAYVCPNGLGNRLPGGSRFPLSGCKLEPRPASVAVLQRRAMGNLGKSLHETGSSRTRKLLCVLPSSPVDLTAGMQVLLQGSRALHGHNRAPLAARQRWPILVSHRLPFHAKIAALPAHLS